VSSNANLKFEEQLRSFYTPLNQYDFVGTNAKDHREISDNFKQKVRNCRDVNEVAKEKVRFLLIIKILNFFLLLLIYIKIVS